MSKETSQWLNTMQLIGFEEKRGKAWHYRKESQGTEPNHYPGAIPVADVIRRLFNFEIIEMPLYVPDGYGGFRAVPNRKAIGHGTTGEVFGVFKDGFQIHQYPEWTLEVPARLLGENTLLGIGSAGLLAGGARAYVQIEVPDTFKTSQGVEFRPNLLAATACDGTLASTFKRTITVVVCDNTRDMALAEKGQQFKVKHSKYSHLRIEDARAALNLIDESAEAFAAEVAALCEWEVTRTQWDALLTQLVPIDPTSKRSVTVGEAKRDVLTSLYDYDMRATPWNGTAFGILQTFNTYNQHERPVHSGTVRSERIMSEVLSGKSAEYDANVLATLAKVCEREMISVSV